MRERRHERHEQSHRRVTPTSFEFIRRATSAGQRDRTRSQSRSLDPSTRSALEPRFGHDFSRVRVYADAEAASDARAIDAAAFTVGHEIVFADGAYAPDSRAGLLLLAHELAHVVQND